MDDSSDVSKKINFKKTPLTHNVKINPLDKRPATMECASAALGKTSVQKPRLAASGKSDAVHVPARLSNHPKKLPIIGATQVFHAQTAIGSGSSVAPRTNNVMKPRSLPTSKSLSISETFTTDYFIAEEKEFLYNFVDRS
ncbi:hypothetical protein BDQ17DRAFT_165896 [Cyathus striatus]|nr:hypothetical protein BDQ17DRAFT_165896 [Cyathus striatus]